MKQALSNVARWLRAQNRKRLIRRRLARDPHAFVLLEPSKPLELPVRADARIDAATVVLDTSETPLVTIVIPAYGQVDVTMRCLASLQRNPPSVPYEVIVAEDASGEPDARRVAQVRGIRFIDHPTNLGFLRSCNAAAAHARGRYLLLLNNDTQVLARAVDAMVGTFERFPAAGLVGAKLVYPDGRLQEAGGIVWRDGSAWNCGRGGDPADTAWNYLREVDYISGAAVMVDMALWRQLGGFDERFAPAYYEDTDLAMQVRHAGRSVLYQPAAAVVHLEGVSSGTDPNSGVKRHQAINSKVFADRWQAILERDHLPFAPQNVLLARDHAQRRRIVLVTNDLVVTPDIDAGSRAIDQSMDALLALGHVVKFWPANAAEPAGYGDALRQRGIDVIAGPQRPTFEAWIKAYGPHLRCAFLHRPEHAGRHLPLLRRHSKARVIYYGHDLHFARLAAQAQVQHDARLLAASDALLHVESGLWKQADVSVYFSREEVDEVHRRCPGTDVRAVQAYSFDAVRLPTTAVAGQHVVFVAGFGHAPNVDAAQWLVQQVMPAVWRQLPQVHLSLVGSKPTQEVKALACARVTVTGWVSDAQLHAMYEGARVAVVPLRFGAGVKHKVVEALARGVPLVTTSVGAQGLPGLDRTCAVADEALALAAHIIRLVQDDAAWLTHASAAARYINEHFSRASLQRQIAELIDH